MNKIMVDVSLLRNSTLEPISLKLAYDSHDTANLNQNVDDQSEPISMWLIIGTWLFIILVALLVSYYLINLINANNNNNDSYDYYEEEDNREL